MVGPVTILLLAVLLIAPTNRTVVVTNPKSCNSINDYIPDEGMMCRVDTRPTFNFPEQY